MSVTTAPPGRVYQMNPKFNNALALEWARETYALREGKPAHWLRCNPADFDRFDGLWPGCVIAELAQLPGTVRLGRD